MQLTRSNSGKNVGDEFRRPIFPYRFHSEDRKVNRRAPIHRRPRRCDFFKNDRRFCYSSSTTAERFRYGDTDPTTLSHFFIKLPREFMSVVLFTPILVRKISANTANRFSDFFNFRFFFKIQRIYPLLRCISHVTVCHSTKILYSSTAFISPYAVLYANGRIDSWQQST